MLPKQRKEVKPQPSRKASVQKNQEVVPQVAISRQNQRKIETLMWNQEPEPETTGRYKSVTGKEGHSLVSNPLGGCPFPETL